MASTRVGAMESLIKQSHAGYVVGDAQPQSLARGIQSIITNFTLAQADQIHKSVLA